MELEVNGVRADNEGSIITINRQVIDVNNPDAAVIDTTNSFLLPRTNTNNQIFNSGYSLDSDAIDRVYQAKLIDQFFLFNGTGFLKEVDKNSYRFQLTEASKLALDELNADLKDLDFESFDFVFNDTNYLALNTEAIDNIWIWPVVAMHQQTIIGKTRYTAGAAGLTYSRPMFRWKKILETMFEKQDWSIEWDNDLLDRVAISANDDIFYVTSYQKTITQSFAVAGSTQIIGLDTNDFNFGVTVAPTSIDIGNTTTRFRVRGTITSDANAKIVFNALSTSGDNEINELFIPEGTTEIDLTTGQFKTSDVNNVVTIFLEGTANIDFTNVLIYTIIDESDLGNFSSNNLVGYYIKAYDNLPEKKQIDIFLDSLVLTNSIILPDSFTRSIQLKTLGNLDKLKSIDWTEKFNFDNFVTDNQYPGLAKQNNLVYNNDMTISPEIGKANFLTDNDNLQDETDYIKLNWSASVDTQINSFTTAAMEVYTDTVRVDQAENNKNLNPRIVYFYDSTPGQYVIGSFNELDWNTLKEDFYNKWFNSLLNPRQISGEINLKKLDVLSLDFLELVLVGSYYYFVLSVEDFRPNFLSKVKLLRIL